MNTSPKIFKIPTKMRITIGIAIIIFAIEIAIMFILSILDLKISVAKEALVDSMLLTLLSAPLIFVWIIQPYVRARKEAEKSLYEINHNLEDRVFERTQELVRAKDEAELANQHKSHFLSRVSHELRTPLNAILGFSQLLELEFRTAGNSHHQEHVLEILSAGNHLLVMINELLDLARVEAGHIDITIDNVNCDTVIEECISLIKPLAEQKQIKFTYEPNIADEAIVYADRTRYKEILLNFLSNAVKYNRAQGKIIITTLRPTPTTVRVNVTDTGSGIAENQRHNLFMPFERLNEDNSGSEGTGIGLAISRQIAKLMHGEIGCDSTPGQGTTFWVELNAQTKDQKTHPLVAKNRTNDFRVEKTLDSEIKILHIDANLANIRLVEHLIHQRAGHKFLSCLLPEAGLELAAQELPDIILFDVNIPGMGGHEFINKLKQQDSTKSIPVVALTANTIPQAYEMDPATDFEDYFSKPIDREKLYTVIDTLVGRNNTK